MADIPEPPRPFVGRRDQFEWFERVVRSHEHWNRPHFVQGAAGIGKTAFVSHIASSRRTNWRTIWFDVSGPPRLDEVTSEINDRLRSLSNDRRRDEDSLVVIDHADLYDDDGLETLTRRILNWKLVRALIVPTRAARHIDRAPVLELAPLTRDQSVELFDMLATVDVVPAIREQVIVRSGGNPMLLRTQIGALNSGGFAAVQDSLNFPIYEFDEAVSADKIIEFAKPKIIVVSGEILAALQKEPDSIRQLSPRKFEEVLADLLEARGMKVELTQPSKDGGRDILARMETDIGRILCLVEAKHYAEHRKVGVELVRQLYGVLCDNSATNAMLVTTSSFTKGAKEFQQRHEYEMSLKDYADVLKWIKEHKKPGSGLILPP